MPRSKENTTRREQAARKTCGGCTACCQIIPVKELGTKPFQGCPHVRSVIHAGGPGCGIYPDRPRSCSEWRCGWLENEDWEDDLRPDRCGFVVDVMLDLVLVNGVERPAAQLWVLPGHEDAHERQPALAVILALLHEGMSVLWRMQGDRAFGFHLNAETGQPEMALTERNDQLLGPEAVRMLRAHRLYENK
jgi:hypothetical protein